MKQIKYGIVRSRYHISLTRGMGIAKELRRFALDGVCGIWGEQHVLQDANPPAFETRFCACRG